MSLTLGEVKKNAEYNLRENRNFPIAVMIGNIQMENNMYIYELSVINEARLLHLGTSLMDLSERIASKLNLDSTFLVVKKCSWMEEWFRRLGYKESDRPLDDNGCITLEKKI